MRPLFVAALLGLALSACATPSAAPLPLTELARGNYGQITTPRREVIRDQASWDRRWSEMQLTRMAPPEVDFSGQMVVAVFMGQRRTGGYAIEVASVEVGAEELVITVRETSPAAGSINTQALTAPYHAVRVAKTELPVRWVDLR